MKALKIIIIIFVILDVIGFCTCKFKWDQKFIRSFEPKYWKIVAKKKAKNQNT
jgi:hypothetical protein